MPLRVEIDGHRAGGVAEVPDDRRARVERLHVGQRAGAVGDVREHDEALGDVVGLRPEQRVGGSKICSSSPRARAMPSST